MEFSQIYTILENKISKKRWNHIKGVIKSAEELAHHYSVDIEQARLAALLHDACKEMPIDELQALIKLEPSIYQTDEVLAYEPLLHGPAGAIYCRNKYGITDETILEAIRVHTVGKINMSLLDKIIFVADYIEPNRNFPGVDKIRKEAFINLDNAVLMGYDSTISFLLKKGAPIYPDTIVGRNYILAKVAASMPNKGN